VTAIQGRYVFGDWGSFTTPSARLFFLDPNLAIQELRIGQTDRPSGFWLRDSVRTRTASSTSLDRLSWVPTAILAKCSRSLPNREMVSQARGGAGWCMDAPAGMLTLGRQERTGMYFRRHEADETRRIASSERKEDHHGREKEDHRSRRSHRCTGRWPGPCHPEDINGPFTVRALTRNANSDKAKELARRGRRSSLWISTTWGV